MRRSKKILGTQIKEMLIVRGLGNCGKSTSIKLAYQLVLQRALKKNAPAPIQANYLYSTIKEVAVHLPLRRSFGIATRGDGAAQVSQGLRYFNRHNCEVIVCATRTRGGSLKQAQQFAALNGFAVSTMQKTKIPGTQNAHALANFQFAKQIHTWACRRLGI